LSGVFSRMLGWGGIGSAGSDVSHQPRADYLDSRILNTPTLALDQARKEIVRMMSVASYMFADIREILFDFDARRVETVKQHEQVLDSLNHEITIFLADLAHASNNPEIHPAIPGLLQTVTDLEHIGDRCVDILDCIISRKEAGVIFSEGAMEDLKLLADAVSSTFTSTAELVTDGRVPDDGELRASKDMVRSLFEEIKLTHFERISSGICPPRATILFTDLTSAFLRIAELCWNIMAILSRKSYER